MSMLDADPPYHTRLRSIVNKAFTPRAISGLRRPDPRARARDPRARVRAKKSSTTWPRSRWRRRCGCSARSWGRPGRGPPPPDPARRRDAREHRSRSRRRVHLRAGRPLGLREPALLEPGGARDVRVRAPARRRAASARRASDITTRLLEAEVDGDRLCEHEFDLFFLLLVTAGNETTRHVISHGTHALLDEPRASSSASRDDPSLVPTRGRGDPPLGLLAPALPPHRDPRRRAPRPHDSRERQGRRSGTSPPTATRRSSPTPLRFDVGRDPNRHVVVRPRRPALLPRRAPRAARAADLPRGAAPLPPTPRAGRRRPSGCARTSSTASSGCTSSITGRDRSGDRDRRRAGLPPQRSARFPPASAW